MALLVSYITSRFQLRKKGEIIVPRGTGGVLKRGPRKGQLATGGIPMKFMGEEFLRGKKPNKRMPPKASKPVQDIARMLPDEPIAMFPLTQTEIEEEELEEEEALEEEEEEEEEDLEEIFF